MNTSSIQTLAEWLNKQSVKQLVVLTDTHVDALYPHYLDDALSTIETHKIVVSAGEANKTIEQATAIWQELTERQYDKDVVLVNFGGGMICDLGGFVASTYKRGIRFINYPTTLLAMIDAAIGGKTAVNLSHIKNCIGLVNQPSFIVPADTDLLRTLPQSELLSGFGELIKYALIGSKSLFEQLENIDILTCDSILPEWIETCVRFKNQIVSIDPTDQKERHVLNFGHTFGHAYESYCASIGTPIPHGVSVAIGLVYESQHSVNQGFLDNEAMNRIQKLVHKFFIVPNFDHDLLQSLQPYMAQDKKNQDGNINFVCLKGIGQVMMP